jgi:hypothetical protein
VGEALSVGPISNHLLTNLSFARKLYSSQKCLLMRWSKPVIILAISPNSQASGSILTFLSASRNMVQ